MNKFNFKDFISHIRQSDFHKEKLFTHLLKVAKLCNLFSSKMNLPVSGFTLGLLHDLGKYSSSFQYYIHAIGGDLGDEEKKKAKSKKGKIDHSTAGGQILWEKAKTYNTNSTIIFEILANCIISHHTGLENFLCMNGESPFLNRLQKETLAKEERDSNQELMDILSYIDWENLYTELKVFIELIDRVTAAENKIIRHFYYGLLTRFLFSCLIDADHTTVANFENPKAIACRSTTKDNDSALWSNLVKKFEKKLKEKSKLPFNKGSERVQKLREIISEQSLEASTRAKGLFTLSAPTGGGKTLSSLRFALHHALHHKQIERIIYVIPYTSIIEQNAEVAREYLGEEHIVEHHCNLSPDIDTERNKILSENWDAPIIFTTMVQFLDSLFSSKTSDARRMHQLAKSIIIFDEIQTLPIKTVYLFNNAVTFLIKFAEASIVLCTATQPLLHKTEQYSLPSTQDNEIVSIGESSTTLNRTRIINKCTNSGWTKDEIADLTAEQCKLYGSTLVIVNTKDSAYQLYKTLSSRKDITLYHLTTNMCPAHRKYVLQLLQDELRKVKKSSPIVCISTQLIEAGVDISFGSVIRYLAGLDSIVQAAGRCNRHGLDQEPSPVIIVNLQGEKLANLPDIEAAKNATDWVLDEFKVNPNKFDNNLLSKKALDQFYKYYFFKRKSQMSYPITIKTCDDVATSLMDLLSTNVKTRKSAKDFEKDLELCMCHGFRTSGEHFCVIESCTVPVIVPYREGNQLINEISAAFTINKKIVDKKLLRRTQQYSVDLFQNTFNELKKKGIVCEMQDGIGLYRLREEYYSDIFGLSLKETEKMQTLIC